jgi:cell wall-associated NlpC family hydrolase
MSVTPELRQQIIDEAKTWLLTPYHHAADVKGLQGGVDCAMLLVRVYLKCCPWLPQDIDPRPYPQFWYLHRDEERYLGWIWNYCEKVEKPEPADIVMYRIGRTVSHGGIVLDDQHLIHAWAMAKKVEVTLLRSLESRLEGYWRLKS